MKHNRFDATGVYTCANCGKRTRNTGEGAELGYCAKCYREMEQENTIEDSEEPKCPLCGVGVNRPKCLFELGGDCPRHELYAEWRAKQRKEHNP